jgi:hypothetical protein
MIAVGLLVGVLILGVVVWRRHVKASEPLGPLAGRDTGVRSAYANPGERGIFRNRRTL